MGKSGKRRPGAGKREAQSSWPGGPQLGGGEREHSDPLAPNSSYNIDDFADRTTSPQAMPSIEYTSCPSSASTSTMAPSPLRLGSPAEPLTPQQGDAMTRWLGVQAAPWHEDSKLNPTMGIVPRGETWDTHSIYRRFIPIYTAELIEKLSALFGTTPKETGGLPPEWEQWRHNPPKTFDDEFERNDIASAEWDSDHLPLPYEVFYKYWKRQIRNGVTESTLGDLHLIYLSAFTGPSMYYLRPQIHSPEWRNEGLEGEYWQDCMKRMDNNTANILARFDHPEVTREISGPGGKRNV